jgi:subtilase-type proteinase RRT12
VYIIDTGIYVDHPDFEGRASFGVDLTGEGYEDFEGHGTHVAGKKSMTSRLH